MDLFKVMGSCLKGPRASDADIAQIPSWLFVRWLSGDPRTLPIANSINSLYNMPIQAQYDLVRGMLYNKINFIKFPKTPRNQSTDLQLRIANKYQCNPALVPELLKLMSPEERKTYESGYTDAQ